jgi:hypothetical protein
VRVGVPEQGTGEHEAPRTAAQNWKPCNGHKKAATQAACPTILRAVKPASLMCSDRQTVCPLPAVRQGLACARWCLICAQSLRCDEWWPALKVLALSLPPCFLGGNHRLLYP